MTTLDLSSYVIPLRGSAGQINVLVEGVHCGGCIARIEKGLRVLDGLEDARLNFTTRRLAVTFDRQRLEPGKILSTVESLGYRAYPFEEKQADDSETAQARWLLRCLAVAGFAAMNVMLLSVAVWSGHAADMTPEARDLFHGVSGLIALPAVAYAGRPFFISALGALRRRQLNMDVPISLGVLLACGMSVIETILHAPHAYFDSAVMLLFFLLCGRYLDHAARMRTRSLAANLATLKARTARRIEINGDGICLVPAAALKAGDRILVAPGDRVAGDGRVVTGVSEVDDSLITGETARRSVQPGDIVYASSLNFDGALTIEISAAGTDTLVDEIERLVERASTAKSRYMRLADRVSRAYAPVVHLTALATAIGWIIAGATTHDAVIRAIAVLIITCPCALALAIPAVQVVASGRLYRAGILLNSGDALERLATVDTIVFDKTGTLTMPEPAIVNLASFDGALVARLARLALASTHPLARALAVHAHGLAPASQAVETPGQGIRATIDGFECFLGSPSYCDCDAAPAAEDDHGRLSAIAFRCGEASGLFLLRQSLRVDAVKTVAALRGLGFDLLIVSGDRAAAVEGIARQLGIKEWRAGCKPAQKIALIEELMAAGQRVLMVGDGINDAPSLAAATASMSPITASDLSQAHADAVFLGDRLAPVVTALGVARRARNAMVQNLGLAVIYNLIAVPLAVAGIVTPLIAAAAMSGSSIIVTLNALRLRGGGDIAKSPSGAV